MRLTRTIPLMIALAACRGAEGPAGPAGPAGDPGEQGEQGEQGLPGEDGEDAVAYYIEGTVDDGAGLVGEGHLVVVDLIDDSGSSVANLGVTMTDSSGAWAITVNEGLSLHPRLVATALVDDALLQAPVTDFTAADIDPATTASLDIVLLITETDGGASLDHYTTTELADIVTQAAANLATAGTDLTDSEAVWDEVLDSTGMLIASYAETDNAVEDSGIMLGDDVPLCATGDDCVNDGPSTWSAWDEGYFTLEAGSGYFYDIEESSGYINDGFSEDYSDAFDDALDLYVDGGYYSSPSDEVWIEDAPGEPNITGDGGEGGAYWAAADRGPATEIVFAEDSDSATDFTMSRRHWADPVGGWLRITDVVTYTGSAATTVDIGYDTDMGSDEDTVIVGTSSGDSLVSELDTWLVNLEGDGSDPISGFWFGTVDWAEHEPDEYYYWGWDDVPFEPGQTRTFVHFVHLWDPETPTAGPLAAMDSVAGDASLLTGISAEHAAAAYNVEISLISWSGESGSVAPWSDITVTNDTTSESWTGQAESDGSFSIGVLGDSGDTLTLTASDGTTLSHTLP